MFDTKFEVDWAMRTQHSIDQIAHSLKKQNELLKKLFKQQFIELESQKEGKKNNEETYWLCKDAEFV